MVEITEKALEVIKGSMRNGSSSVSKFAPGTTSVLGHEIDELQVWMENDIIHVSCLRDGVEVFGTAEPRK